MSSTCDTSSISLEDDNGFKYGLSDPSILANQKRTKIFDLLNRLHNTGVSADIDLPSIAVIGSQSVGKSSLIEAMSGIALPRESGTCTRCPTECRLSSSEGIWRAQVSIRLVVDEHGDPLQRPTLQRFGDIITSKTGVEERIKRAQLAILNPNTPAEDFLTVDLPFSEPNESRFSKNSIILDISGPGVDDLAFVDLPGVIVSGSADGDDRDIEDVETLVGGHIEKPNYLILLAVTCETDPENQRGRHLAKKYDPNGDRTIPVLTKPDRIQIGDEDSWMVMMRNQKEKFKHGWYCVKQPGTAELRERITWEQARQNEREFFQRTSPWSTVEWDLKERLGTEKLSAALGQKLFDLIVKRLPEVSDELHEQLEITLNELGHLPPDVGDDPATELLSLIRKIFKRIEDIIDGSVASELCVVQSATDAYERFIKDIGNKTPRFRPVSKKNAGDDEFQEFPAALELDTLDTKNMTAKILHLDDILQMAKRAVTRELPGNYPYHIKVELIKEYLKPWERPSKALVQEVETRLRKELKKIVETEFAEHTHGGLQLAVWNAVDGCLRKLSGATMDRVEEAYKMEQLTPTTRRDRHFLHYRNHYLEHYRVYYQSSLQGDGFFVNLANRTLHGSETVSTILTKLLEAGVPDVQETDLLKLAPYSENEEALSIMAEVRAYYHIAMQRYIEKIPMLVDHLLVLALKKEIPKALLSKLPLGQRGLCTELLKQADDVTAKRKELNGRRQRLEDAREELSGVWVG